MDIYTINYRLTNIAFSHNTRLTGVSPCTFCTVTSVLWKCVHLDLFHFASVLLYYFNMCGTAILISWVVKTDVQLFGSIVPMRYNSVDILLCNIFVNAFVFLYHPYSVNWTICLYINLVLISSSKAGLLNNYSTVSVHGQQSDLAYI